MRQVVAAAGSHYCYLQVFETTRMNWTSDDYWCYCYYPYGHENHRDGTWFISFKGNDNWFKKWGMKNVTEIQYLNSKQLIEATRGLFSHMILLLNSNSSFSLWISQVISLSFCDARLFNVFIWTSCKLGAQDVFLRHVEDSVDQSSAVATVKTLMYFLEKESCEFSLCVVLIPCHII